MVDQIGLGQDGWTDDGIGADPVDRLRPEGFWSIDVPSVWLSPPGLGEASVSPNRLPIMGRDWRYGIGLEPGLRIYRYGSWSVIRTAARL